ncbi:MAG: hypothetical protein ACP5VE_15405, partial [Chthonomonadales bacterium]
TVSPRSPAIVVVQRGGPNPRSWGGIGWQAVSTHPSTRAEELVWGGLRRDAGATHGVRNHLHRARNPTRARGVSLPTQREPHASPGLEERTKPASREIGGRRGCDGWMHNFRQCGRHPPQP